MKDEGAYCVAIRSFIGFGPPGLLNTSHAGGCEGASLACNVSRCHNITGGNSFVHALSRYIMSEGGFVSSVSLLMVSLGACITAASVNLLSAGLRMINESLLKGAEDVFIRAQTPFIIAERPFERPGSPSDSSDGECNASSNGVYLDEGEVDPTGGQFIVARLAFSPSQLLMENLDLLLRTSTGALNLVAADVRRLHPESSPDQVRASLRRLLPGRLKKSLRDEFCRWLGCLNLPGWRPALV